MRTRLPVLIAALTMAVASGCTTTSAGTPSPDSSSSAGSQPSSDVPPPNSDDDLPSDGAPQVETPLDVSHFEENPCDVLKPEDAQELNVPATGDQEEDALGKTCYWHNGQTQGMVTASFFSDEKRGLSSIYREAKGSEFPYFEAIEDIDGHPAVAFNTDEKPVIDCTVAVGISDQLVFTARVDLSTANIDKTDPCEWAARVAGMMMETMQEAT
jgi:Protein of unknown function (DUF3558)